MTLINLYIKNNTHDTRTFKLYFFVLLNLCNLQYIFVLTTAIRLINNILESLLFS